MSIKPHSQGAWGQERQTDRQPDRQAGRQKQRDRQTDRQTDRQREKQRQRETGRQREIEREQGTKERRKGKKVRLILTAHADGCSPGPVVWYQRFEYAIGHWLQKCAEHVFGCVLCAPGCFSLFRARALLDDNVMRTYASEATLARHTLQYDQGGYAGRMYASGGGGGGGTEGGDRQTDRDRETRRRRNLCRLNRECWM